MITLGSLFDGIGGFPLAAIRQGITPLWASEIESFPIQVTKHHFPEMLHVGDITKLDGAKLPPVDIICGGSPCQDLSVASCTRAGLAGTRSGLFLEQIRVTKEMRDADIRRGRTGKSVRPRWLCWENVPGVFSSGFPKGEDFRLVLEQIAGIAGNSIGFQTRKITGIFQSNVMKTHNFCYKKNSTGLGRAIRKRIQYKQKYSQLVVSWLYFLLYFSGIQPVLFWQNPQNIRREGAIFLYQVFYT